MNIQEFSGRTGLSPLTLRYCEKIGILRPVQRLPSGHRCFVSADLDWVAFVRRLNARLTAA